MNDIEKKDLNRKMTDAASEDPFAEAFGEPLVNAVDIQTWSSGQDLPALYSFMEREVSAAVDLEKRTHEQIRKEVFPQLATGKRAAPESGLHKLRLDEIEKAHSGLLFNGGVEACDGTIAKHDSLALTIAQIGVCLVTYRGESGSYAHQLFRRDLRQRIEDPVKEALQLLERRQQRRPIGIEGDELSELAQRSIMGYAERALLLDRGSASWRMGHGNPTPYELMTGYWASRPELVDIGLDLMARMVLGHQRFVYIPSAPARHLLQIGQALHPLEYCILYTAEQDLAYRVENGGTRGVIRDRMAEFARDVGSKIAVGLYRVSRHSPPHLFYAHVDFSHMAALIAMSDSVLQLHRGFPMLIDIADGICRSTFSVGDFLSTVGQAYTRSQSTNEYLVERATRV